MGKFGFHSGAIRAQNIQAGTVDITTDSNGDGTASVTLYWPMKNVPAVVLTQQELDITGTCNAITKTATSFVAQLDGSSVTSGIVTVGYVAMDFTASK
jgi:hypothetical protein